MASSKRKWVLVWRGHVNTWQHLLSNDVSGTICLYRTWGGSTEYRIQRARFDKLKAKHGKDLFNPSKNHFIKVRRVK